jgi:acetyl esterase/lipase
VPPNVIPKGGPTISEKQRLPNFANVAYGDKSKTQIFDLYLSVKGKSPYPVVIYAHPGGFSSATKVWLPTVSCKEF